MAHYIGKFSSEAEIQQALDNGLLLKPYVAQYGSEGNEQIDYNSKSATPSGSINLSDFSVSYGFTVVSLEISADTLYWQIDNHSSDWYGANAGQGFGDYTTDLWINQNDGENQRSGQFTVNFYYDDTYQTLRNSVTITITQEGHIIADGYVDPSALTLSYYSGQEFVTVYGESLYWVMAGVPGWISLSQDTGYGNTGVSLYINDNPANTRNANITVNFYTDSAHQNLKNTVTLTVEQEGQGNPSASWNSDYYVSDQNVSSASGSTNIYIICNPDNYYVQFYDFEGNTVTGTPQTTAFTVNYGEATTYETSYKNVWVGFYTDDTFSDQVAKSLVNLIQDGNPNLSHITLEDQSQVPYSGDVRTLDVILAGEGVKWQLQSSDGALTFTDYPGESTITGDTSVTAVSLTIASNQGQDRWFTITGTFYNQNDEQIGTQSVNLGQAAMPSVVTAVCTFITTVDGETVNVSSYNGGDWSNAYIDNDPTDVLTMGTSTYAFPSAGTHTITYEREGTDPVLQGWLQHSDMVSCSLSANASWGFHGSSVGDGSSRSFLDCTNLTAVTFDDKIDRIGDNTFEGCTALTVINCYATSQPNIEGQSTFRTITNNQGTLHIPSGSSYPNWESALGSNWTVVDDL